MLAALLPHGDKAWFFKLAGSQANVDKYAAGFRSLVESVKFSEGEKAEPQWTLPDGWQPKEGKSEMRFATISLPEDAKGLEVSVVALPWRADALVTMLLTNINRWRKQMQLPEVRADELTDAFETMKLPVGDAMLVDLKGKLKLDAMQPPFAGMKVGAMPAGHPPLRPAESDDQKASATAKVPEQKTVPAKPQPDKAAATAASFSDPRLPFTFDTPVDWTPKTAPTFAVAAFATKDAAAPVEVSITPMMGPGGDLLSNVNRWRAQLRLPEISVDDLASTKKPLEVGGKFGDLVQLVAPAEADPRQAITAGLINDGDVTWIFRMRGTAKAVGNQQTNFEKFLSSVKFKTTEK